MSGPQPGEHGADTWAAHRPNLETLSAELAAEDPVLARSMEAAMQMRDAILVELVGGYVASAGYRKGAFAALGGRIVAEARAISGHGTEAQQAGGH